MRLIPPERVRPVDLVDIVGATARPEPEGRPWIFLAMIQSADGAAVLDGRAGGLGNDADRRLFLGLRGVVDVVLAGAETVRVEGYGPVRLSDDVRAARRRRGQSEFPRLAVVSRSLHLAWQSPLFVESAEKPIVITAEDADREALERARRRADVIAVGHGGADLVAALRQLRRRGVNVVDCEGGPALNGQLLEADMVDELVLTVAPVLLGGEAHRIIRGSTQHAPRQMRLTHAAEEDGYLFLRYVRRGA